MRMFAICLSVFLLGTTNCAHAACSGRIETGLKATGTHYDPFDPIDQRTNQSVTIRNTGNEPCRFMLAFVRTPSDAKLGNAISYAINDRTGNSLIFGSAPYNGKGLYSDTVKSSGVSSLEYYVFIPRAQVVSPGYYTDRVTISIFSIDDSGEIHAIPADTQILEVECEVSSSLSINLAGGGLTTSVDFGELADGKERVVILQARANRNYRLEFKSKCQGNLLLNPSIPGQDWSIGYGVYVDGIKADMEQPLAIAEYQATSKGEESHKILFRISNAEKKRAGIYRDTITIDITPIP